MDTAAKKGNTTETTTRGVVMTETVGVPGTPSDMDISGAVISQQQVLAPCGKQDGLQSKNHRHRQSG